jgi:two-component system, OmpR family, phosphate regulon response regulator PhoB
MNILLLSLEDKAAMPEWYKCNLEAAGFSIMSMVGDGLFNLINEWRPDIVLVTPGNWSKPDSIIAQVLKSNPATRDILVVEMVGPEGEGVHDTSKPQHVDAVIPYAKNPLCLAAHIQNLLAKHSPQLVSENYTFDNLTLSNQASGIYGPEGLLPLSRTEYRLLDYLMRRPGRTFSRHQLLHAICGMGTDLRARTLDVYMARLRRGLRKAGANSSIQTLRGVGYAFMPRQKFEQPAAASQNMIEPTRAFGHNPMRVH